MLSRQWYIGWASDTKDKLDTALLQLLNRERTKLVDLRYN